jgi:AcrR family transcriptional regulator
MPQIQKGHVRTAIIAAATTLFAEVGFEAATMGAVAERAGSSVGNVYKYFANKEELFAAALPTEFAVELRRMTRARIKAVGNVADIRLLPPGSRYHVLADELLDFCLANRERVVILLHRAEGTPFATFADDFVERLVDWTKLR